MSELKVILQKKVKGDLHPVPLVPSEMLGCAATPVMPRQCLTCFGLTMHIRKERKSNRIKSAWMPPGVHAFSWFLF